MSLRSILKALGVLALIIPAAVGLLLLSLWLEHHLSVTLPTPTGSFAVGRIMRTWIDQENPTPSASTNPTRRTVLAWVWYPAANDQPDVPSEDYIPAPWRKAFEASRGVLMGQLLARDLSRVKAHSLRDPPIAAARPTYPVIIFRAGLSAQSVEYSALTEDLASHGYIVVGIDAPYRTGIVVMPDGNVVERSKENNPEIAAPMEAARIAVNLVNEWVADVGFTLDQLAKLNVSDPTGRLTGKLDLRRVGVVGHSLGGATAAQFCLEDSRCKAGIDIDGALWGSVVQSAPKAPFLFLMSDHSKENDPATLKIRADLQAVYRRLPEQSRSFQVIRGANHFNFSDAAVVKSRIAMSILRLIGAVKLDGKQQLAVTAQRVRDFLDRHLAATQPLTPDAIAPGHVEIVG